MSICSSHIQFLQQVVAVFITNYRAWAIFASATCKIGNSVCKFCFSANGLQTELQTEAGVTICVPILLRVIFCLQISVFSQIQHGLFLNILNLAHERLVAHLLRKP